MPSEPSRSDDGPDGAPDTPESPPRTATTASTRPNYLIRRALVVGGVVAVLATASIVIGQLMGSGAEGTPTGAPSADWDRIVLVDDRSGRVVVTDDGSDGEEIGRFGSGVRTPIASDVVDESLVTVSSDEVAVVDLGASPDDERAVTAFEFGADDVVSPTGSTLTMIAPRADAGRAVLVHGPSGDVIDTDSFAPVAGARYEFADARADPSGRHVLVTDSGNFQSVLFSFDRDEPSFFPGLALAIDDDIVVTAQNVGSDATISVFGHDGEPVATGRTPSVRAALVAEDSVVLVTVDGAVATLAAATGDTTDGPDLDIGTILSGHVTNGGERLVISGAQGTAVVDAGADVIGDYPDLRLDDDAPPMGSRCITLVPLGAEAEPEITVVDIISGAVELEATARPPRSTDASGCTIAAPTPSGFDLLGADRIERVDSGDRLVALAPDASTAVVERDGRLVLLVPFGVDGESVDPVDPVDLGPDGRTVHFTRS